MTRNQILGPKGPVAIENERNHGLAREDRSDEKLFQCWLLNRWGERESGVELPTYRFGAEGQSPNNHLDLLRLEFCINSHKRFLAVL